MRRRHGPSARRLTDATAPPAPVAADIIDQADASLLDVIDSLLNKGVVVNGEVILAIADVELIYLRVSLLLSAADRVLPPETDEERAARRRTPRTHR